MVYDGLGMYGAHALVSRQIYISRQVIDNQNDLAVALILFGEWQHHPDVGSLGEQEAQAEFELVRESIPQEEITPFIAELTHGGSHSFWWPFWW